jgi:ABC-type uncharacterized transport system YnjBCD ATPase subunit
VLDKPLAVPRIKKKERRNQSFTGGDEFTAATAGTEVEAKESGGARARVVVLRVQRGAQELERELK